MAESSPPADQPWAPFPVQDWSAMPPVEPTEPTEPAEAAGRAGGTSEAVDPDRPAPASRRPRWLPSLVIVLVFALAAGGVYALARASRGEQPISSGYLPADGAAWTARLTTTSGAGVRTDSRRTFDESARMGAVAATETLPAALGGRLLAALQLGQDDAVGQVWRVTSVELGSGTGAGGDQPGGARAGRAQRSRFYRTDRGIELLADAGPDGVTVYRPGLRELPADPRPGMAWSSAGTAGPGSTYRADFSTTAADGGCLSVTGRLRFGGRVASAGDHRVQRTWCPGRGITAARDEVGTGATDRTVTEAMDPGGAVVGPTQPSPRLSAPMRAWGTAQNWRAQDAPAVVDRLGVDDAGTAQVLPSLPSDLPPVVLASGQLVRAVRQGRDLLVLDPPSGTSPSSKNWRVARRLHPGADPTMLAGYGDVIVVATTDRTLTAYTDDGLRLWQHTLDDVVSTTPVRSGDAIAAVSAAGTVTLIDLFTGRERWRVAVGSDVAAAPVVLGPSVIIADRAGRLTALHATDGSLLWQQSADTPTQLAALGSVLVVVDGSNLDGRASATGALVWRRPLRGSWRATVSLGPLLVVATSQQSVAVTGTGRELWRRPGYDAVVGDGRRLVGLRNQALDVIEADGSVSRTYPLAAVRGSDTRSLVGYGSGVLVSSTVFADLQVWS